MSSNAYIVTGSSGGTSATVDLTSYPADAAAGLKPQATEVKTNPFKAAKEIRMIAKWLAEHMPGGNTLPLDMSGPLGRLKSCDQRLRVAKEHLDTARVHAQARQARPTTREIDRAIYQVAQTLAYQQQITMILNDMVNRLAMSPGANATFKKQLNKLHVLVQSLPTEPDMPVGAAESVLRAITTLLRNIGMEVPASVVVAQKEASDASP